MGGDAKAMDELDWKSLDLPQVSEGDGTRLDEPYSEQEPLRALKKMNLGLPVKFYRRFLDLVKAP